MNYVLKGSFFSNGKKVNMTNIEILLILNHSPWPSHASDESA